MTSDGDDANDIRVVLAKDGAQTIHFHCLWQFHLSERRTCKVTIFSQRIPTQKRRASLAKRKRQTQERMEKDHLTLQKLVSKRKDAKL